MQKKFFMLEFQKLMQNMKRFEQGDLEDSEPYWEISFIDTIGTLYGISEDKIINIELSNKQEFEIGIYGERKNQ